MNATSSPRKRPTRSAVAEALRDTLTVPSDSIMDRPPVNVAGSLNDIGDQCLGIKQALNRLADAMNRQNVLLKTIADAIDPPRHPPPTTPAEDEWTQLKDEREAEYRMFHHAPERKPLTAA